MTFDVLSLTLDKNFTESHDESQYLRIYFIQTYRLIGVIKNLIGTEKHRTPMVCKLKIFKAFL